MRATRSHHSLPMNLRCASRRSCTAWITLLVVLFQALLPLAGHAGIRAGAGTPADAPSHWVEICGASGLVRLQLPAEGAAGEVGVPADDGGTAPNHCPACTLHEPFLGVPQAAFPAFAVPLFAGMPPTFLRPVPANSVWRTPRSRAPPNPT